MLGIVLMVLTVAVLLIVAPIGIWNRLIKMHQTEREILKTLKSLLAQSTDQTAYLAALAEPADNPESV